MPHTQIALTNSNGPLAPKHIPPLVYAPPAMPLGLPDPQAVLRGHAGEVQALDFDASERFLVSGCAAATARCVPRAAAWHPDTQPLWPPCSPPLTVQLSPTQPQQTMRLQGLAG